MDQYDNRIERARMLMMQGRWDLAEDALRQAIAEDPDRGLAYSFMALIQLEQENYQPAQQSAERALSLSPDDPFGHYVLSSVFYARDKYNAALEAIEVALNFDPTNSDFHARKSAIALATQQWDQAIASAELGLQFDPDHIQCNNIRAMALTKVGRRDEAGAALDAVLHKSPEDPLSHANVGWNKLHAGQPKEAAEHFKEALRLDPNNEWARSGIIESLKANNIVYRQILRYMLWVSQFTAQTQMIAFIGIIVLLQVLVRMPQGTILANIGLVAAFAYMGFVCTLWLGSPLFDLLLRFNRYGRMALTDDRRADTNYLAIAFGIVAVLISGPLLTGFRMHDIIGYVILLIPVAVTLGTPRAAKRKLASICVVAIFSVACFYWYRWYVDMGIDGIRNPDDLTAFIDSTEADAALAESDEVLDQAAQIVRLASSQNRLHDFFFWPSVLMSWLSGFFHQTDK